MRFAFCLLPLLLSACIVPEDTGEDASALVPALSAQKDMPQLALIEFVLEDYFARDIANRPTICVSIIEDGQQRALSPPEETALILRFDQLAPFARCVKEAGEWRDRVSDEPALVFGLHSFACQQQTRCAGWAGYQAGAAGSLSNRYTMDWLDGEWTFVRDPSIIADDEAPGGLS